MFVVVHYSEIGTKGKNRPFFEKKLVDNIRSAFAKETYKTIKRSYGRIIIELQDNVDLKAVEQRLKETSGIANFSFTYYSDLDLEKIKEKLLEIAKEHKDKTFRISAKRSNKEFKPDSQELNEVLGELLVNKLGMKVSLGKPEVAFFVEITERGAFIYTDKIAGFGGLPVGVTGKVVSLLSGGLDSPVASYKMFKRGCSVVFVHFLPENESTNNVENKIVKLVDNLKRFQFKSKLYLVPFNWLQMEIIKAVPAKYRMIVYRRIMFRIAEKILEKEGALGFVTGDSIAQVASQTLENLNVIYEAAKYPVFAPLIGDDKREVIQVAEKIGTFDISTLPYSDCCSFMIAEHPETKSKLEDIKSLESNLKIDDLINKTLEKTEVKVFMNKRL
ncbi:MAG: tRNA 4-thiouridine(8) synthase ThiI [Candidatus Woesearchaeota archaeon]|nr:MAG: tRNA 4-thiouridine(8) synthase ThiI [Candidatus Woesearchaeota archaeon]